MTPSNCRNMKSRDCRDLCLQIHSEGKIVAVTAVGRRNLCLQIQSEGKIVAPTAVGRRKTVN